MLEPSTLMADVSISGEPKELLYAYFWPSWCFAVSHCNQMCLAWSHPATNPLHRSTKWNSCCWSSGGTAGGFGDAITAHDCAQGVPGSLTPLGRAWPGGTQRRRPYIFPPSGTAAARALVAQLTTSSTMSEPSTLTADVSISGEPKQLLYAYFWPSWCFTVSHCNQMCLAWSHPAKNPLHCSTKWNNWWIRRCNNGTRLRAGRSPHPQAL
ncbi:hypothetical protein FN846DRAFT_390293 [Sphaerosporella brunnea]|uniref:Uncharacterized protein n=1 Tax=Sphaerosporella brunnea TaxID=1250544 RepID=A0A5J5EHV5_9PEZI|nr:hypothetical protein FN846DRAFT_390293 [Sphaerosporella brunnea]